MNKRLLLCLGATLIALLAPAQSFNELWKQYDAARRADRPRTALTVAREVARKALDEGNNGQLVKALFAERQLLGTLSPDSLSAATARLERLAAAEQRPTLRAVFHSLLAELCRDRAWTDTARARRAADHYRASVAPFAELAAASAEDFVPAAVTGKDSRYFRHDLLSLLGRRAADGFHVLQLPDESRALSARLVRHYADAGLREAVLLFTLDSIGREPIGGSNLPLAQRPTFAALSRLAEQYEDLDLNVETYIALTDLPARDERDDSLRLALARRGLDLYGRTKRADELRNVIAAIERTTATIEFPVEAAENTSTTIGKTSTTIENSIAATGISIAATGKTGTTLVSTPSGDGLGQRGAAYAYPGQPFAVALRHKNLASARIRFYRLPDARPGAYRNRQSPEALTKGLAPVLTCDLRPTPGPAWKTRTDTLVLSLDRPGRYVVALEIDKDHTTYDWLTLSRYQLLSLQTSGPGTRLAVVDRRSGRPVPGVTLYRYADGHFTHITDSVLTDHIGAAQFADREEGGVVCLATPEGDYATCYVGRSQNFSAPSALRQTTLVYTDRAVYRPGQDVRFSLVRYAQRGDSLRTVCGDRAVVRLVDTNQRTLATDTLVTDAFGMAADTMRLPAACLPGRFALVAGGQRQSFRVEEYKRPTFTAELAVPDTAYAPGDSVVLCGTALTYNGVPVADATVRFTINALPNYWIRRSAIPTGATPAPVTDSTTTDAQGRFAIGLRATLPPSDNPDAQRGYRYSVSATVTAPNGESAEASAHLVVNRYASTLSAVWPATLCAETLPQLTFYQYNANRQNLTARGEYVVLRQGREVARDTFLTGRPFRPDALAALTSGPYKVVSRLVGTTSPVLTDTADVFLFNNTDPRLPDGAPYRFHAAQSERRDSATLYLSLPDSAHVYVDVVASSGEVTHSLLAAPSNVLRIPFNYRPEYGDGATISLAFVSEGKVYTHSHCIYKPEPRKQLHLRWTTFRSRLRPGQDEEWRLRVTHPDGRPATAALTATLYDASLDRFASLFWPASLSFTRNVPFARWYSDGWSFSLSAMRQADYLNVDRLRFDHFDTSLTDPYRLVTARQLGGSDGGAPTLQYAAASGRANKALAEASIVTKDLALAAKQVGGAADMAADEAMEAGTTPTLRTDFAETAYFAPALHTDADGEVTLSFTLPQSLTRWNFRAVAHTTAMDIGVLDTAVVATKDFTVTPNLPRFLRSGDATTLPVTLRNLSDAPASGTVCLVLADAASGRTISTATRPFSLEAQAQQSITFDCRADATHPLLVCRVVAESERFSDGEEHYLPVLSDKVMLTNSVPFTAEKTGTTTFDLSALAMGNNRRPLDHTLTVEMTARPEWAAVAALPALAEPQRDDAFSLAASYYALTLGADLARTNPKVSKALRKWRDADDRMADSESPLRRNADLRQLVVEETPWLAVADEERENRRHLADLLDTALVDLHRYTALDRLGNLQNADGSWSWFKGMTGSTGVTLDVATMLARLQALAGDPRAATLVQRAAAFLDRRMADEVKQLRDAKDPRLSSHAIRYLYLNALTGRTLDGYAAENAEYLKKLLRQPGTGATLTDKALTATTLSLLGDYDTARERLASLEEYLVEQPGMGWTFDAARRPWTRTSDLLSAHTAYLEAALRTAPTASTKLIDGVRQWMVLTRQTTYWDDPRQAADAVYALFCQSPLSSHRLYLGGRNQLPTLRLETADSRQYDVNVTAETASAVMGYTRFDVRLDKNDALPVRLTVEQADSGLTCGAVYARYVVPAAEANKAATGIAVERVLEVWRDGRWTSADGTRIQTGERLRTRYVLTADRDFDFVCLKATRPACLEPRRPLSGYTAQGGTACYRACLDASTRYYFDHLGKGRHELTDEFTADRPGTYSCGLAEVRSCYAPEFGGRTREQILLCE